jgi:hypothetical protein
VLGAAANAGFALFAGGMDSALPLRFASGWPWPGSTRWA